MDNRTTHKYTLWQLVENGRNQRGISKKELYRGIQISLKHQMSERDADNFDKLTWDYLLGRMGISNMVYEGYIYAYEFELYRLHETLRQVTNQILYVRYQRDLGEQIDLKELQKTVDRGHETLKAYEQVLFGEAAYGTSSGMLHHLFLQKMEGYLLVGEELLEGTSKMDARKALVIQAWEQFNEGNCLEPSTLCLSKHQLAPAELECLVQSAFVLMDEGQCQKAEQVLTRVWDYRTHHEQDLDEQVKLYPYVAWMLSKVKRDLGHAGAINSLEQGLELLIASGKMNGLIVILEGLLKSPDYEGDRELLAQQRQALLDVSQLTGINIYGVYPLVSIENMIHVNELVRQKRQELGLTQQQLCDGIISWEWYSKFEHEHYCPSWEKISVLLMELGLPYNRCWLMLDTDQVELMRAYIDCRRYIRKNQYELMDDQFHWMKVSIDLDSVVNRQYIAHMEGIIAEEIYAQDYPGKCADFYKEALVQSVPNFPEVDYNRCVLGNMELCLILDYVFALGDGEKTLNILEQVVEGFEKKKISAIYKKDIEKTFLENTRAFESSFQMYRQSLERAENNIKYALKHGEIHGIYSQLYGCAGCISEAYPRSSTMKNACDYLRTHALVMAQLERATFWIRIINAIKN